MLRTTFSLVGCVLAVLVSSRPQIRKQNQARSWVALVWVRYLPDPHRRRRNKATAAIQAPIPGYAVVDITWQVDAFSNGTLVNVTGTIQQIYDQISEINPN